MYFIYICLECFVIEIWHLNMFHESIKVDHLINTLLICLYEKKDILNMKCLEWGLLEVPQKNLKGTFGDPVPLK